MSLGYILSNGPGAEQAAEEGLMLVEIGEKQTSGAKALLILLTAFAAPFDSAQGRL